MESLTNRLDYLVLTEDFSSFDTLGYPQIQPKLQPAAGLVHYHALVAKIDKSKVSQLVKKLISWRKLTLVN